LKKSITSLGIKRPGTVYAITLLLTLVFAALLPRIQIDTDPENMLPADQADRVFHNQVKTRFALHDAIVVGIVNDTDPDGIFNVDSLGALHALSEQVLALEGVVRTDVMSLSLADNITQGDQGEIRFSWMMKDAPSTTAQAGAIRDAVNRLPLLLNTLVSEDGRAAAVYVPIESKDLSYPISLAIQEIASALSGDDQYHITGLPVAEDTFGVQMFQQMAVSAPLAGLMIFLLMWFFFRSARLVIAPMIVAMVTVIVTMGLLVGLGFTVHIMSSMIPIFLMPIAVVDSVHIMSEFSDHYETGQDVKATISRVVDHLYVAHDGDWLCLAPHNPRPPCSGFRRVCCIRRAAGVPGDNRFHPGICGANEAKKPGGAWAAKSGQRRRYTAGEWSPNGRWIRLQERQTDNSGRRRRDGPEHCRRAAN
jgi:predicted RND superfamily exporter protein